MAQDQTTERTRDIQEQLAAEFSSLPTEVVERCFNDTLIAYQAARIADFVPLFVHRETRSRLLEIARTAARG